MSGLTQHHGFMTIIDSPHNIVFKCSAFTYYFEEWQGLTFVHIKINKFSHNIYKKMVKTIRKLQKDYKVDLFGYGEDESTYKLMKMAGFIETNLEITNDNKNKGMVLCLQEQQY